MPRVKGKSTKCPTCGHTISGHDYTKSIEVRRLKRESKTLDVIDLVVSKISEVAKEKVDLLHIFSFLSEIEVVQDIVVRKMSRVFLEKKMYLERKDLRYLRAMIINESSTYGARQEQERIRLDRLPPKVD
jgi:KaiC/GvpD/RAD55 family RecA-like ATPase|tara:strand:- start:4720 stop:5109 length:390 start_codon:yes stop_codon:yes gene_type:complete